MDNTVAVGPPDDVPVVRAVAVVRVLVLPNRRLIELQHLVKLRLFQLVGQIKAPGGEVPRRHIAGARHSRETDSCAAKASRISRRSRREKASWCSRNQT